MFTNTTNSVILPPFAAANAIRRRTSSRASSLSGVADQVTPLRRLAGLAGPRARETNVMIASHYGVIYIITCSVNLKEYVGLTTNKNPDYYIQGHFRGARRGDGKF